MAKVSRHKWIFLLSSDALNWLACADNRRVELSAFAQNRRVELLSMCSQVSHACTGTQVCEKGSRARCPQRVNHVLCCAVATIKQHLLRHEQRQVNDLHPSTGRGDAPRIHACNHATACANEITQSLLLLLPPSLVLAAVAAMLNTPCLMLPAPTAAACVHCC